MYQLTSNYAHLRVGKEVVAMEEGYDYVVFRNRGKTLFVPKAFLKELSESNDWYDKMQKSDDMESRRLYGDEY